MGPSPPPGTLTQNPDSVALHISSLPFLFPSFSAGVKTVLCFLQVFLLKRRVACLTQACVQTVCLPHLTLVCTQTRGFFPSNGNLAFTASF